MLIVIPVSASDLALACLNLKLAKKLDAKCYFMCVISAPAGLDTAELEKLVVDWSPNYTGVHRYDDWKGDSTWPRPQNWAWQATARHVVSLYSNMPWLWWEADATPLKSGWFKTIADAYSAGGKPFAGHVVNGSGNGHMNGVAVYPPDVGSFAPAAFLARSQPFDRVLSQHIGERLITPINHLIGHYLKPPGRDGLHIASAADAAPIVNSATVLYHGSSDGSLARYMLNPASFPAKGPPMPPVVPSFTEQTKWESGYFTFPAADNTVYFNPGVCESNGVPHLFTRRWRYSQKDPHWKGSDNTSDLAIWRIKPNMMLDANSIIPRLPLRHPHEQWEDPRVVMGRDGVARVSFVTWTHKKPWPFHQVFARMSADWSQVEGVIDPVYRGNGPLTHFGTGPEKNWTWFEHDGAWHCRYAINPGDVFVTAKDGLVTDSWRGNEINLPWKHSKPLRGGTPPVRVGSEYVSFFHSHLPWNGTRRRYFMGAFAFQAKPPFALTRIVEKPILSGSTHDFMGLPNALPCIFPSGAILKDDKWLVTFGVNDEACGWIKIPRKELDRLLVKI